MTHPKRYGDAFHIECTGTVPRTGSLPPHLIQSDLFRASYAIAICVLTIRTDSADKSAYGSEYSGGHQIRIRIFWGPSNMDLDILGAIKYGSGYSGGHQIRIRIQADLITWLNFRNMLKHLRWIRYQ